MSVVFELGVQFFYFVVILLRLSAGDAQMNLTISSPLESHKAHTLCFSLCGVDVGFENPIFAAIEVRFSRNNPDSSMLPLLFN